MTWRAISARLYVALLEAAWAVGPGDHSDKTSHIDIQDDSIDTEISHIDIQHPISITRMTISLNHIQY
jgi:hypothetical protein